MQFTDEFNWTSRWRWPAVNQWTGWWMIDASGTSAWGHCYIAEDPFDLCGSRLPSRVVEICEFGSVICRLLLAQLAGSDGDDDHRKPASTIKRRINAAAWTCRRQATDCPGSTAVYDRPSQLTLRLFHRKVAVVSKKLNIILSFSVGDICRQNNHNGLGRVFGVEQCF